MKSFFASFVLAPGAEPVEATVLVFDHNLNIGYRDPGGGPQMISWSLRDVDGRYQPGQEQTKLQSRSMPGALLLIEGDAWTFIRERLEENSKPWYARAGGREVIRNSVLCIGLLAALVGIYLLIVPWISQQLAGTVSVKTEERLGNAVFSALRLQEREDPARTLVMNDFFQAMKINTAYDIRISVVQDPTVNAFALPGGHIVVYTGLLDRLESYPQLAALLCHEFIHVNNKHATKSIFRRLGSKVFISVLFGRFGTVASILVNHADDLKSLTYSRRLEKQADLDGLELLRQRQIDPAGFTDLFEVLKRTAPANDLPELLASHPDTEKRIRYIETAATGATKTDHPELKAIFEMLKRK